MTIRKIVSESQTFNNIGKRKLLISYDIEVKVSGEPTEVRCDTRTAGREKENTIDIYIYNVHTIYKEFP